MKEVTENAALRVEILHKERLHQGFVKLDRYKIRHQKYDGSWIGPMDREIVVRPACVAVLPYDPIADKILLIEQFRLTAQIVGLPAWQREVVAGIIEENETPEDVARREALEEAGCTITDLIFMYHYLTSSGVDTEVLTLYLGRMDSTGLGGIKGVEHEHEDIRSTLHPASDVEALLVDGRSSNAALVTSLQWFLLNRDAIRTRWR